MAQGAGNRRGKKQNNYFDIGNKGRVTGTEVADTGNRDEYGFELVDDFFPPTGKTDRTVRRKIHATDSSDVSMDIVLSSGPSPGEALTGQSTRTRNSQLPPRSSPVKKTSLGATPKRISVGPASPTKPETPSEAPPSTNKTVHRRLNFSMNDPPSAPGTHERSVPLLSASSRRSRNVYSLSKSPERGRRVSEPVGDVDEVVDLTEVNGDLEDDYAPLVGDDGDDYAAADDLDENADIDAELDAAGDSQLPDLPLHSSPSQNRAQQLARQSQVQQDNGVDENSIHASGGSSSSGSSRKRAAPDPDEPNDSPTPIEEPPTKRRGPSPLPLQDSTSDPSTTKRKPKRKGGRPKKQTTTTKAPRSLSPHEPFQRAASRPMQRIRHETPADAENVHRSRYGRTTYQPLAYWKGEHAVYRRHDRHASVQEIVRMDDVTPIKPPPPRGGAKRKKPKFAVFEDEDAASDSEFARDDWETDDGVVVGPVRNWDAVLGNAGDEINDAEIAFSSTRIDPRDVAEATFRYAKTLTMPFFGSGVVELPPGGFKSLKNSKKMLLVFFVFYGKVTVNVSGTQFAITRGGQWQVPRGNLYSIKNETSKPARCFFAQGCEVAAVMRSDADQLGDG